jgi:hypothetical protein
VLDLIFIFATYAEIFSVSDRKMFRDYPLGGMCMVGRGARLYRLIKLVQQYRIRSEQRKRERQERGNVKLI